MASSLFVALAVELAVSTCNAKLHWVCTRTVTLNNANALMTVYSNYSILINEYLPLRSLVSLLRSNYTYAHAYTDTVYESACTYTFLGESAVER